jgi:hypothetical protein
MGRFPAMQSSRTILNTIHSVTIEMSNRSSGLSEKDSRNDAATRRYHMGGQQEAGKGSVASRAPLLNR